MIAVEKIVTQRKMWGFKMILIGILGVLTLGGSTQAYASEKNLRSVSGEIEYVDVKLGELKLEGETTKNRRYPTEFRLNSQETIVTDPTDKKFLNVKDLKVGQHVTVEFNWVRGEWREPAIALKIIAFAMPELVSMEVTGELEAIDAQAGTLIVERKPLLGEEGRIDLVYFVFDPRYIVAMRAPSIKPARLVFNPGDIVKVGYVVRDGKRYATSITLISAAPEITNTTTTTTTSTTVTQ